MHRPTAIAFHPVQLPAVRALANENRIEAAAAEVAKRLKQQPKSNSLLSETMLPPDFDTCADMLGGGGT